MKAIRTDHGNAKPIKWIRNEQGCMICVSHSGGRPGYPRIYFNQKRSTIARLILHRRHGQQSPSVVARHTCDNRLCINPDHILAGSQADNLQDMTVRGRHGQCKLTKEQVLEIRRLYKQGGISQRQLASKFGMSQYPVARIVRGIGWKHI